MTGWESRKSRAEIIEATRIPDAITCPGSLRPRREDGTCSVCFQLIGPHYPTGVAHKHKSTRWLLERMRHAD